MLVGIMGGTFDPIHQGHLLAAELAREAANLDQVWFIPSLRPPHKQDEPMADPQQRLAMARLAIEGHPSFRVDDIEIRKGGISYTFETVERLVSLHPSLQFVYIIGADMVMYLPRWHKIDEVVRQISFIGMARPGHGIDMSKLPAHIRNRITLAPMLQMELSSTEIRQRLVRGKTIRYMVPEPVRLYMEEQGIYADK